MIHLENNLLELVGSVGFPVIISLYLLTRIETKMEKLSESIYSLNNTITKLEIFVREDETKKDK